MDVRSLFATALSYTIEEPVGPCSARNGHLTTGLRLLTIQRLTRIDESSIEPVLRQTLPQRCQ